MKLFKKVAIVGTGLIGGSIGLALKKKKLADSVVGISRRKKNLLLAKKRGIIDSGSKSLDIVKGADLVILATPVDKIIKFAPAISRIAGKECIVTDVGSTKKEIVLAMERFFPNYLGSHPLAGSEKCGAINAQPDLFNDTLCILTPTKKTRKDVSVKLERFWNALGARVIFLSAENHDRVLSFVSHLPHAVAFSLIESMPKQYLKFSPQSLKDTTRIAASDSELWADIFLSNRKNILKAIALLENNLSMLKQAINKKEKGLLIRILKEAQIKRKIIR
ncbi:MAG: prephenate dehydrogenase [Candidatus Omnitrophota bacterium]